MKFKELVKKLVHKTKFCDNLQPPPYIALSFLMQAKIFLSFQLISPKQSTLGNKLGYKEPTSRRDVTAPLFPEDFQA